MLEQKKIGKGKNIPTKLSWIWIAHAYSDPAVISSKGFSILYLFLLADLLCCAAVITIFYGFFNKKINSKLAALSIISGLISGLLFFPSQDFQSSILVGNLISINNFSTFIKMNLLFISFLISLIVPLLILSFYSLRNSFK